MLWKEDNNEKTGLISSLAPLNTLQDDPNYKVYKKYLNEALGREDITNIAVMGNFGIGKSSILRSYEKESKKQFIYISLGDFQDRTKSNSEKKENELEYSLLCQILALSKKKELPKTSFGLVPERDVWFKKISWIIFIILIILLAAVMLFINYQAETEAGIETFLRLVNKDTWFVENIKNIENLSYLVLGVIICLIILMVVVFLFRHIRLSKILLKTEYSEAEMETKSDLSYLDQNRFELVYVLEQLSSQKKNTIVFEDMDRLERQECIDLFQKLREINILVNQKMLKNSNSKRIIRKQVNFVYVINDNIFQLSDKLKFFDYIMPIVPALSSANADVEIRDTYLKKIGIEDDSDIVKMIAAYISDYRILNNIINEFRLFHEINCERGNNKQESKEACRLLAFVIFKNVWPEEYYLLCSGRSKVFNEKSLTPAKRIQYVKYYAEKTKRTEIKIVADLMDGYLGYDCIRYAGYSVKRIKEIYKQIFCNGDMQDKWDILENDKDLICLKMFDELGKDFFEKNVGLLYVLYIFEIINKGKVSEYGELDIQIKIYLKKGFQRHNYLDEEEVLTQILRLTWFLRIDNENLKNIKTWVFNSLLRVPGLGYEQYFEEAWSEQIAKDELDWVRLKMIGMLSVTDENWKMFLDRCEGKKLRDWFIYHFYDAFVWGETESDEIKKNIFIKTKLLFKENLPIAIAEKEVLYEQKKQRVQDILNKIEC